MSGAAAGQLHVLVLGPGPASVSDALRFDAVAPDLARLGVGLLSFSAIDVAPAEDRFEALEAAISWADVIVFRRAYRTWHACLGCSLRTLDAAILRAHAGETGHPGAESPFSLIRPLVGLLEAEPAILGPRAIVYETDDDFFSTALPDGAEDWLERDLIERILGIADLVTTTTPVLAGRLAPRTHAPVRVIRNALDPAWYDGAPGSPHLPGDPRVLYHGVARRLDDFEVARPAVEAVARDRTALRRVWLGACVPEVAAVVDEVHPFTSGLPEFAQSLVAARPDIGLAPLRDTTYNRARSELHWLEYALAGAPAIVSAFDGAGPYDVVRDGCDGLVARSPDEWDRHLRALAGSATLRADLAGRARERVVAAYDVAVRAPEWADAYRWAAEHGGAGRRVAT